MQVNFEDSDGKKFTAKSEIKVPQDVILFIPQNSVFPFEVKAVASANCPTGKPSGENSFTVTAFVTIILKVTATTDLLLPTYGYCTIPPAVDFEKHECGGFHELPLYPSGR